MYLTKTAKKPSLNSGMSQLYNESHFYGSEKQKTYLKKKKYQKNLIQHSCSGLSTLNFKRK